MPAGTGGEVYRTGLTRRGGWVFVVLCLLLIGSGVITAAREPASRGSTIASVCLLAALVIVPFARAATAAVFTDAKGVRIRNVILTDRFLWDDIDRFELRKARPYSSVCVVVLRNGTALKAKGIQAADGWVESDTAEAQGMVDELNAELRRARLRD